MKQVLFIRTDSMEAYIAVGDTEGNMLTEKSWEPGRMLSREILSAIDEVLASAKLAPDEIDAVAVFLGPGSYTGLRIGATVANTLCWSLKVPCVGVNDENWIKAAGARLEKGDYDQHISPEYGGNTRITKQKK